MQIDHHLTEL